MGALSRPDLPDGPARALSDALHALHHRAGWPSLRDLAREIGCSRTTVAAAFSEPRLPRWGLLELLVEALGGDTEHFHALWLGASGGVPDTAPVEGAGAPPDPGGGHTPRQIPADVAAFTGREQALAELDRLLAPADTVSIAVLAGTAGVGKTALAVRWAHRAADRFPDGQLYIDLRGYDPGAPLAPADALAELLRGLGVPDSAMPLAVGERAARYRSLLDGRRMLVLLDNAQSVEQVRDLLPGAASCAVLLTSRDALSALVARHGAARLDLVLLDQVEAVGLLRTLIGDRVDAEPESAAALAHRCACLPLALRVAAEYAAGRPLARLADLVAELDSEPRPLDLLSAGEDDYTAVRAVFSWSYRHLRTDVARLFGLLGLHPGTDFDAEAVAALSGCDPATARRLLETLVRNHLVQRAGDRRYGLHDLLRAYAAELAAADEDSAAARDRLLDHYQAGAVAAADDALPGRQQAMASPTVAPVPPPGAGTAWLEAERSNLLAVARASRPHALALSRALASFLDARGHYTDAYVLHTLAVSAARASADLVGEADALNLLGVMKRRLGEYADALTDHERAGNLHREAGNRAGEGNSLHNMGVACWRCGRYREARDHLHAALSLHREAQDRSGEGGALYNLGIVYRRLGDYPQALQFHRAALEVLADIGDRAGVGRALNNAGVVHLRLGSYAEAVDHFDRALAIQRDRQDRAGECVALTNLGLVHERLGSYDDALTHLRAALAVARTVGYRVGQADALRGIGVVLTALTQYDEAIVHLQAALATGREIGEADVETGALNELGAALIGAGRHAEATAHHQAASALALSAGDRYEQARAFQGLARTAAATGDLTGASAHRDRAHELFTELGLPEAGQDVSCP